MVYVTSEKKVWPEPFPEWSIAIQDWDWMWFAHIYGFGSLFALATLYAFFCFCRFRKIVFAKQRVHFQVMNLGLMVAGLGRSLGLFWDPYFSRRSSSVAQNLVLLISWGVSTACITSAFSIMLLIFLETTKTKLGPPKMRNLPFLVSITLTNIIYMVMSDLVVWFYPEAKLMIFICHIAFAIWGLAISVGYFVAGFRMWRNLKSTLQPRAGDDRRFLRDVTKLKRLFRFMSAASVFGVCNFSVSLYISVGEFGVFAERRYAKHWPWFAIHTTMRMLELLLTFLVFRIAVDNPKDCAQRVSTPVRKTTTELTVESQTASWQPKKLQPAGIHALEENNN